MPLPSLPEGASKIPHYGLNQYDEVKSFAYHRRKSCYRNTERKNDLNISFRAVCCHVFWTFIRTLINNPSCTLCRTNQWHDLDQASSAGLNLTHDDSGTGPASSEDEEEVVLCNASGQKHSCDWQLLLPRMGSVAVSRSSQTSICISQVPVKKIECVFEKGGLTWTKLHECKMCGHPASSIFIGPEPLSEVSHPNTAS